MERVEGLNGVRLKNGCDQAGAYGLVCDSDDRLLIVQANTGRFYLPGGRIEPFETAQEALVREIDEECGWAATVNEPVGEKVQLIFEGRVSLLATYWKAARVSLSHDCPEHRTFWVSREEALSRLHRQSDRSILGSMPSRLITSSLNGAPSRDTARQNSFFQSA